MSGGDEMNSILECIVSGMHVLLLLHPIMAGA
jgi:hypothetical protein